MNFVIAINNEEIFEENFDHMSKTDFILKRHTDNVPKSYNEAILLCDKKYICFVHQDVFLPDNWENEVYKQIANLHHFF